MPSYELKFVLKNSGTIVRFDVNFARALTAPELRDFIRELRHDTTPLTNDGPTPSMGFAVNPDEIAATFMTLNQSRPD